MGAISNGTANTENAAFTEHVECCAIKAAPQLESRFFLIRAKSMDLIRFEKTTAVTAAAGAADALDTLLLFFTDIKNCRDQDQHNNRKNGKVFHSDHYFFSAYSFASFLSALAHR